MKLDKIRFARVVTLIATRLNVTYMNDEFVADLDQLIDVELPQPDVGYPSVSDINMLMHLMAAGTQKIEAIKLHRKLTGWGLKESEDQVEKYWVSKLDSSGGYYPSHPSYAPPKAVGAKLDTFGKYY